MSTPNDGGPAHPCDWVDFQPTTGEQVVRQQFPGLSKREWFAGQAIAGMCASDYWCMNAIAGSESHTNAMAVAALAVADAALKALDDNNVKK